MKKENLKIKSNCDGLLLDCMMFIPDEEIKGIVQISHGMAEHKERYYKFMEYLTNKGYITIINDHRGHGLSIKDSEDLGYFYDTDASYIVSDLYQITKYVKSRYPNKKVTLLGHSMGSMVVRKYIKLYDKEIDKLIVCGSPSENKMAKIGLDISKIIGKIKGDRYRSKFIQNMAFGNYNKKFKEGESSNRWICKNEETVKEYDKDRLCGFIFTTNGFQNLFKLMIDIYDKKNWELSNKKLPIFFIAGSDDPVIGSKEKWLKSQNFLKNLGYENIKGKLYEGLRHEILNEEEREVVYQDIIDFIGNEDY